jgi:hypothetical protein
LIKVFQIRKQKGHVGNIRNIPSGNVFIEMFRKGFPSKSRQGRGVEVGNGAEEERISKGDPTSCLNRDGLNEKIRKKKKEEEEVGVVGKGNEKESFGRNKK